MSENTYTKFYRKNKIKINWNLRLTREQTAYAMTHETIWIYKGNKHTHMHRNQSEKMKKDKNIFVLKTEFSKINIKYFENVRVYANACKCVFVGTYELSVACLRVSDDRFVYGIAFSMLFLSSSSSPLYYRCMFYHHQT